MLMEIRQLSFRYGRQQVLQAVDACLQSGEVVALVGANGSGKTTLLQLLLGDLRPERGQLIADKALYARNSMAYMPDKPPLYPDWRVQELLLRLAAERGVGRDAVEKVLARCALQAVKNKKCRELSHGYKQRVCLAQALLHQPRLLCMDEPMNGLDEAQRSALRVMIAELAQEGMTVVLTLHDLADVAVLADRVWYLRAGRLFDLPLQAEKACTRWAVFSSIEAAQAYTSGVQEGCARGFNDNEFAQLASALFADAALDSVGRTYPVAALQARMAACG